VSSAASEKVSWARIRLLRQTARAGGGFVEKAGGKRGVDIELGGFGGGVDDGA
jgi:hypothetical protein